MQSRTTYPFEIAKLFDVALDELRNFNGWEADVLGLPGAGRHGAHPAGRQVHRPNATTTTAAGDRRPTTTTGGLDADDRPAATAAPRRTRSRSGDAPLGVTRKFDITLEALNAANADTPDWPNFYTGREIKLPPRRLRDGSRLTHVAPADVAAAQPRSGQRRVGGRAPGDA